MYWAVVDFGQVFKFAKVAHIFEFFSTLKVKRGGDFSNKLLVYLNLCFLRGDQNFLVQRSPPGVSQFGGATNHQQSNVPFLLFVMVPRQDLFYTGWHSQNGPAS
jgi:hypothetical protein